LIEEGDLLANKYQLEEAFEKYNRALQYLFVSFNGVHEKLALINKKIAGIYYKVGDFDTAIMSALSSCEIYESLLGPEHVETI
jgi:tetratricopeptide (TPR) repeat protein